MTGKTRKITWMAASLLIGTAGGTMAGPGIGPWGPWNSGGGFGGFGPYQPYVARGCNVQQGMGTSYWVSRRPARLVTTVIRRAEPVAEQTTTIRRSELIIPATAGSVWTKEVRFRRPARAIMTTETELLPSRQLEVVGERITTLPERRVILDAPSCGAGYMYR